MNRTVIIFGICLAALLAILKWVEYRFFTHDLTLETYVAIVGLFCTGLGGWIGWNLTKPKGRASESAIRENMEEPVVANIYVAENKFGLSKREFEVLSLIARGYSYQLIADELFVSITTIKTHASNIFVKMDVQRRTQAVMVAYESGILSPTKA